METYQLLKDDVSGYEYNTAVTLIKKIDRILKQKLFEYSTDGMVGLDNKNINTIMAYKSNISIKKSHVKQQSIARAATSTVTKGSGNKPKTNAQEEADWQNTSTLTAIGVKEAIPAGITAFVGNQITNTILRTMDRTDFQTVNQYELHQLLTAIKEGAERLSATTIRGGDGQRGCNHIRLA